MITQSDIKNAVVAKRYTKALLELAQELKTHYGVEPVVLMPRIHKNYSGHNLLLACRESRIECYSFPFYRFQSTTRWVQYVRCYSNLLFYPYIYLKDVARGTGGSFAPDTPIALRVYNAPDAVKVSWYFDGKAIAPGADGSYHLTRSGELKAVVTYRDSAEIITKKIVVK